MSLFTKTEEDVEKSYVKVWDIIELLLHLNDRDLREVAQFFLHYKFEDNLALYYKSNYEMLKHKPLDDKHPLFSVKYAYPILFFIQDLLLTTYVVNEKEIEIKEFLDKYYWDKNEVYIYKPFVELIFDSLLKEKKIINNALT
ncbi:hypothetical protein B9T26_07670 [Acinetobacter sp. ANC 4169]|uniref:hypothetical protein n=1 Tax=Acinetobacter sp. ANC 4169 TaxID=1977879 RepID=UPI000A351707|nr:hypothetical protein [Acinetobacter sp. ANC 4169]OTG74006.1 hypothetical protein B9T26_07670 [Acinetobacter sp. ANC 4169]